MVLLYLAYNHYSGYQWVMQNLIGDNISYIDQHPELTNTQKLEVKLGFEYTFLKYIKEHSPEDAIVLLPFDQQHFANPKFTLQNFFNPHLTIMRKEHVASFIYPRKVVLLRDRVTDPNYMRATHLAIVDFHGYELLPGHKDRNIQHGLLNIVSNSIR